MPSRSDTFAMTSPVGAFPDPNDALDLVRECGREVRNFELATWLGLPEHSTPLEVLLFCSRLRRITYLDWNEAAGTWWWNTSATAPGAQNRLPRGRAFPALR